MTSQLQEIRWAKAAGARVLLIVDANTTRLMFGGVNLCAAIVVKKKKKKRVELSLFHRDTYRSGLERPTEPWEEIVELLSRELG